MELTFEECETAASEDELLAALAAAKTNVAPFERKRPARKPLPEHLPRERVVIVAPDACPCYGSDRLCKLGEDITETLEVVPRQWKVVQTVWEKFSCRDCEKITQPPAPFHATPRGLFGPSFLAMLLFEKFGAHQPLRRAGALRATFMDAPKQFEAYKADAIEALEAFEPGKTLDRATAAHDFDFARLKHEPHTVYLITPSERLGVIAPWISLIVNYAIEAIARERGPLTTTFILDEFPQLPPAPAITKALRLYAGRGVQLWFFSQGRYSMEARWSKEAVKEIEDQASIFTMTGVEDPDLMRDVEQWSVNRTIVTHGQNVGGGAVESSGRNRGESRRAVLQSEDIRAIGAGKQIIKVAGPPTLIVCDRVPFYTVDPWKDQIRDVREMHKGNSRKS